ncbi:hypothetical protein H7Y63_02550 [Polaromonas sp.]|nr:hypothetical protein [Candidatus Saccharibacteria bacterium]
MASKKIPIGLNPAEAAVEQRVEAMMSPVKITVVDHTDTAASTVKTTPKPPVAAPIDIFNDPRTAPAVPANLLEKLTATVADEPKPTSAVADKTPVKSPEITAPKPLSKSVPIQHDSAESTEVPTKRVPVVVTPPNRVPQLIASTAPKPAVPAGTELTTPDAAPAFMFTPEVEATPTPTGDDLAVPALKIDDAKSDAAVAAIAASEGDELLAAQDSANLSGARTPRGGAVRTTPARTARSLKKRVLLVVLLLLVALAALIAIPTTRYKVAGLLVKRDVQVLVLDSKTSRPVSKATLLIDGRTATTDASGVAHLSVPVGNHQVAVSKQYYAEKSSNTFIDFKKGAPLKVTLVATGRQVPITVTDKLTGKPISGVEISVLKTSAKTDKQGKAIIVLPTKTATSEGNLTNNGYNAAKVTIQITDGVVPGNSFTLTQSGKIYFLSNENGTIDVVKANLDGTNKQTVVKGTGKEDPNTTVLLAAHDWRFSVLKAQRDSSQAALYLIDSSNDKLVEFDSGDASFTPIGWYGHNFMYDAVRNSVATSQNSHELIKSYDAERGQLNQLDASQADGSGASYSYQGFYNFNILDNLLVYNTQWYSSGGASLEGKSATIRAVQPNGQGKKDYQNIPAAGLGYVQAAVAAPQDIYYAAFNYNDSKTTYFEFQNQGIKTSNNITAASFNKLYPNYVVSPNGKQALWSEQRNGKSVVLLGDASAANSKMLTNLAGFNAYGWYSDSYILVSKKNSELYLVGSDGTGTPIKLADYFRPAQSVVPSGYGGL